MKKIILILAVTIVAAGCVSTKKQRERAHEFFREYPEELAELCADRFPPEIVYRPGETIIKREPVIVPGDSIPCPDIVNPDTGKTETPKVKCPDCKGEIIEIVRVDTMMVADKAREEQYRLEGERLRADLYDTTRDLEESRRKAKNRLNVIFVIIALVGVYVLGKIRGFVKF